MCFGFADDAAHLKQKNCKGIIINFLSDIITYVRRKIKTPSNTSITDALIIDYINRFYLMDVQARIQLYDYKTKYTFLTTPGVDRYNMPLYSVQTETTPGSLDIAMYPVYQGFLGPAYIYGIEVKFETQQKYFFDVFPQVTQGQQIVAQGNGTNGPYTFIMPISPGNSYPANPPINAILRGHVDLTGIMTLGINQDPPVMTNSTFVDTFSTIPVTSIDPAVYITTQAPDGSNMVVTDSGVFVSGNVNNGFLMSPGAAPYGNTTLPGQYVNSFAITGATNAVQAVLTVTSGLVVGQVVEITGVNGMTQLNGNYYTVLANTGTTITINVDSTSFGTYTSGGVVSIFQNIVNYLNSTVYNLYFPDVVPEGVNIYSQCYFYESGLPRGLLYFNNCITLRNPPDQQYLVQVDAYLSPAAFFNSSEAIPFGYMAEYLAAGAARKILADTGDWEQFDRYEPLFREQEMLVWKRSQRQFTSTRTQTIYSQGNNQGQAGFNNSGTNSY